MTDRIAFTSRAHARVWNSPFLLLALTSLIWAGHSIVGKLAVGEIGPMTLTFLRWSLALGPIWFAARKTLRYFTRFFFTQTHEFVVEIDCFERFQKERLPG